jgi:hypothetical protein
MKLIHLAALSASALLGAAGQAAAGEPENCDFFRNSLIGTRCAQSYSLGIGGSVDQFNVKGTSGGTTFDLRDTNQSVIGTAAWTPNNWLTLSAGTSYHWFSYKDTNQSGGSTRVYTGNIEQRGLTTLTANANLYDSGAGSSRFVLNGQVQGGGIEGRNGGDSYYAYAAGLRAAAQWQLGSAYSLNARSTVLVHGAKDSSNHPVTGTAKLLLAHDGVGVAVGPFFRTVYRDDVKSDHSAFSNELGGALIVTPFRASSSPLLSGLVLSADYMHSLGQARYQSSKYDATEAEVTGLATFHFKY